MSPCPAGLLTASSEAQSSCLLKVRSDSLLPTANIISTPGIINIHFLMEKCCQNTKSCGLWGRTLQTQAGKEICIHTECLDFFFLFQKILESSIDMESPVPQTHLALPCGCFHRQDHSFELYFPPPLQMLLN